MFNSNRLSTSRFCTATSRFATVEYGAVLMNFLDGKTFPIFQTDWEIQKKGFYLFFFLLLSFFEVENFIIWSFTLRDGSKTEAGRVMDCKKSPKSGGIKSHSRKYLWVFLAAFVLTFPIIPNSTWWKAINHFFKNLTTFIHKPRTIFRMEFRCIHRKSRGDVDVEHSVWMTTTFSMGQ